MKLFKAKTAERLTLEERRELVASLRAVQADYDNAQRALNEVLTLVVDGLAEALDDDQMMANPKAAAEVVSGARGWLDQRQGSIRSARDAREGMMKALGLLEAMRAGVKGK